ncbi:hypothetical protein N8944_05670 [Pseudomonadales bacterium]|nr:hypothetical protein [Pseudomonadales bacterium]MDA8703187.1 hypothetical protein [Pseudomonadales bacterium]
MSNLARITNFVQLTPTVGTAGQPRAEYFVDVAAAGYDVVLNWPWQTLIMPYPTRVTWWPVWV